MADDKSSLFGSPFALPPIDPRQAAAWARPAAPAPVVTPQLPPGMAPPKRPEDWIAAANATPGAAPPAPPSLLQQQQPAAPAPTHVPKNGDWNDHNKFVRQSNAKADTERLEGATFYDGPGSVGAQVGGAPVLVSKGGRTPHSWAEQTAEGLKFSPEVDEAAQKSFESQRKAIEAERNAGINKAAAEAGYYGEMENQQRIFADQEKARRDRQAQAFEAETGKLKTLVDQTRSGEIDPNRFWRNADTATQISVSLGAILGGIGQGLIGGRNAGLDKLNNAIENDLKAQQANIANNREKVSDQRGVLAALTHQFGEENTAAQAFRVLSLEAAKNKMLKMAAETNTDSIIANAQKNAAALDLEIAKHKERFETITQDRTQRVQNDVNAPAQYAGGSGAPNRKGLSDDMKHLSDKYEAAGIPSALSSLVDADRAIDTMGDGDIEGVGPVARHIPNLLVSERANKNRQIIQGIKNDIGHAKFGGALSPTEAEKLNAELDGANNAASLRNVVQSFRQRLMYRQKNIAAAVPDDARQEYSRRGGPVIDVPLDKPTTPYQRPVK